MSIAALNGDVNFNGDVNVNCGVNVDLECNNSNSNCDVHMKCNNVSPLDSLYHVSSNSDRVSSNSDGVWVASSFKYAPLLVNSAILLNQSACVVCQFPAYNANMHVCGVMACSTCDQSQHRCVSTTENRLTTDNRWMSVANIPILCDIISNVRVLCHNEGCDFLGSRAQYIAHNDECGFKRLTCTVCEESVQRSNIPQHEIGCSTAVCPVCLTETTSKEVKEHAKDLSKCPGMEEFSRKLRHPLMLSWVSNLVKQQSRHEQNSPKQSSNTMVAIRKRKMEQNESEEIGAEHNELIPSEKKQNVADEKQSSMKTSSVETKVEIRKDTSPTRLLTSEEVGRIKSMNREEIFALLKFYGHCDPTLGSLTTVQVKRRITEEVAKNRMVLPAKVVPPKAQNNNSKKNASEESDSEQNESEESESEESESEQNESKLSESEATESESESTENAMSSQWIRTPKTKKAVVQTIIPAIKNVLDKMFADVTLRDQPVGKTRVQLMDFVYQRLDASQKKVWDYVKSQFGPQQWGRDFSRGLKLTPYHAEKDVCQLKNINKINKY